MTFPPLSEQSCSGCRYFRPRPAPYQAGICRRTAPQIGPRGSEWPSVTPNDWCGEWAAMEASDA